MQVFPKLVYEIFLWSELIKEHTNVRRAPKAYGSGQRPILPCFLHLTVVHQATQGEYRTAGYLLPVPVASPLHLAF